MIMSVDAQPAQGSYQHYTIEKSVYKDDVIEYDVEEIISQSDSDIIIRQYVPNIDDFPPAFVFKNRFQKLQHAGLEAYSNCTNLHKISNSSFVVLCRDSSLKYLSIDFERDRLLLNGTFNFIDTSSKAILSFYSDKTSNCLFILSEVLLDSAGSPEQKHELIK
jgi:hypothetical protein